VGGKQLEARVEAGQSVNFCSSSSVEVDGDFGGNGAGLAGEHEAGGDLGGAPARSCASS